MRSPYYRTNSADRQMHLVAEFNLSSGDTSEVVETVTLYVENKDDEVAYVFAKPMSAPDYYEQSWAFYGPHAKRRGLNKVLRQMGFPELETGDE